MLQDILHDLPGGWIVAGGCACLVLLGLFLILLLRKPRRSAGRPAASRFNDTVVNRDQRYALGIDTQTGGYYLSIPVANRRAGYEEYYAISEAEFLLFQADAAAAVAFADSCRRHEQDDRLIIKPGHDRGSAN